MEENISEHEKIKNIGNDLIGWFGSNYLKELKNKDSFKKFTWSCLVKYFPELQEAKLNENSPGFYNEIMMKGNHEEYNLFAFFDELYDQVHKMSITNDTRYLDLRIKSFIENIKERETAFKKILSNDSKIKKMLLDLKGWFEGDRHIIEHLNKEAFKLYTWDTIIKNYPEVKEEIIRIIPLFFKKERTFKSIEAEFKLNLSLDDLFDLVYKINLEKIPKETLIKEFVERNFDRAEKMNAVLKIKSYKPATIFAENTMYLLKHPLNLTIVHEDNSYYFINYKDLGMAGTGRNTNETKKSFAKDFSFLYKSLISTNDEQLTTYNRQIKDKLKDLVVDTISHRIN